MGCWVLPQDSGEGTERPTLWAAGRGSSPARQEGSGSGKYTPAHSLEPWLGVGGACAGGHLSWFLSVGSWGAFCPALPEEGHLAPHPGDHLQLRLGSSRAEDKASPGSSLLPGQGWALADGENKLGVRCKTPTGPLLLVGPWLSA